MSDDLYIWIERWGDFQQYEKKRGQPWVPPWIKIYPRLLDEPRYLDLTPETRSLLVALWLAFANTRGTLTKDTRRLSRQLQQRVTERQLETLNHAGWISFCSGTVREQFWSAFRNGSPLEVEVEVEPPLTPQGGNGKIHLTAKDLRRYTGCKMTRGTHGQGWKHDPLGTDKPPPDWPHDKPTRDEVEQAILLAQHVDEFPF